MSTINSEVHPREDQEITKGQIVKLFEIYIEDKYGSEFWNEFRSQEEIEDVYNRYFDVFGDSIFQVLVDTLAKQQNISIKNILSDFSEFVQIYY